ncbi:MAG TPA: hypothetical protein VF263_18125 [Longimicrobiaceae bacterium]
MKTTHSGRALLAGVLLLAACGRDGARGSGTVRFDTTGTTVTVSNPERGSWTDATAWKATEEHRIGKMDGGGPEQLAAPVALEVDRLGRLYVLDAQASEVRVFGADGRHVRSFGRSGGGPGELRQPIGMLLDPAGHLWVVDPGNARYSVFDTTGALRAVHRRDQGFSMLPWPGAFDREGRLYDAINVARGPKLEPALLRFDPRTGRGDTLALPVFRGDEFTAATRGGSVSAGVPYSPTLVWTLGSRGDMWSGVSDRYRIRHHRLGGDTLRVVEREAAPVPVSAAERDSLPVRLKWFTDQGGKLDLSRVPDAKPPFVSIHPDDEGNLWVRPSAPAGERSTPLDVFDPEGVYLGRVVLPAFIPEGMPMVVRGGAIHALVLGEGDVPQIVKFRVRKGR